MTEDLSKDIGIPNVIGRVNMYCLRSNGQKLTWNRKKKARLVKCKLYIQKHYSYIAQQMRQKALIYYIRYVFKEKHRCTITYVSCSFNILLETIVFSKIIRSWMLMQIQIFSSSVTFIIFQILYIFYVHNIYIACIFISFNFP